MKRVCAVFSNYMTYIFLFSLFVRLGYNIFAAKGYYPERDAFKYQAIALNMLHNHCYCLLPNSYLPTVDRAPLWPTIIALIYGVAGEHDHFVRLFLCVLGAGTCILIYAFAHDLFGFHVGIIAGSIAAIYPFLYIYDGWLYSESLSTFLLLAFCYTLYRFQRCTRLTTILLAGVLLGLTSLARPNGLLVLCASMLWFLLAAWAKILSWRTTLRRGAVILLIVMIFVVPWTLRNYLVSHSFVPVAVGDGTVLLGAYNDKVVGTGFENGYYEGIWLAPERAVSVPKRFTDICDSVCEVDRETTYKYAAIRWIKNHMSVMPTLLAQHMLNFWQATTKEADLPINRYPDRHISHLVVGMMQIMTPIILALAAYGLLLTRKRWREFLFIYLIIVLMLVQSIVFYGIPRFRAPLEPFLVIFGAGAIFWLANLVVGRIGLVLRKVAPMVK